MIMKIEDFNNCIFRIHKIEEALLKYKFKTIMHIKIFNKIAIKYV